ncbi:MAG TPA: RidA family protein [Steroidobacteraceae bacterium]|nr:RidA family protein [Steroidobacteraceae bacterium]
MSTETLQPAEWARPKGYANGMAARGRMIFISGQVGWDGQGHFTSDNLAEQVKQALRNIVRVLEEAQAEPRHLVRLTWYVLSREAYLREAREIGAGYREVLGKYFPAMSVVEVRGLVEQRALVEIEATAVIPDDEAAGYSDSTS